MATECCWNVTAIFESSLSFESPYLFHFSKSNQHIKMPGNSNDISMKYLLTCIVYNFYFNYLFMQRKFASLTYTKRFAMATSWNCKAWFNEALE